MKLSPETGREARDLIAGRLGLEFRDDRKDDLERALERARRASRCGTPEDCLAWLRDLPADSPPWKRLASDLTIGETYFFRDSGVFAALEGEVLPALVAKRRSESNPRLRIWSAGCATGEEPYSLAIALDRLLPDRSGWAVTVLATDIDNAALQTARLGLYRDWSFRQTPEPIRARYFQRREDDRFELDPEIRRMVTFAPLNLAEEVFPDPVTNTSAMDLILCRNVLMYFTHETQLRCVVRLQRALVNGGWLVISPAESSADLLGPLVPVSFPGATLYRRERAVEAGPAEPAPDVMCPSVPRSAPAAAPVRCRPPGENRSAPSLLQEARLLADRGDLEEARRLCAAAAAQDRLSPESHVLLAAICLELADTAAAVAELRRALYLAPDSASAHFLLGTLLVRQGKKRRGRKSLETVVTLLEPLPADQAVPCTDGLTAGRLKEVARAYLAEA